MSVVAGEEIVFVGRSVDGWAGEQSDGRQLAEAAPLLKPEVDEFNVVHPMPAACNALQGNTSKLQHTATES